MPHEQTHFYDHTVEDGCFELNVLTAFGDGHRSTVRVPLGGQLGGIAWNVNDGECAVWSLDGTSLWRFLKSYQHPVELPKIAEGRVQYLSYLSPYQAQRWRLKDRLVMVHRSETPLGASRNYFGLVERGWQCIYAELLDPKRPVTIQMASSVDYPLAYTPRRAGYAQLFGIEDEMILHQLREFEPSTASVKVPYWAGIENEAGIEAHIGLSGMGGYFEYSDVFEASPQQLLPLVVRREGRLEAVPLDSLLGISPIRLRTQADFLILDFVDTAVVYNWKRGDIEYVDTRGREIGFLPTVFG